MLASGKKVDTAPKKANECISQNVEPFLCGSNGLISADFSVNGIDTGLRTLNISTLCPTIFPSCVRPAAPLALQDMCLAQGHNCIFSHRCKCRAGTWG